MFRRISLVELRSHDLERGRRQAGFKGAARRIDQEEIVPLLNAGCGQKQLPEHASADRNGGSNPDPARLRQRTEANRNSGNDEKRIVKEIVDG